MVNTLYINLTIHYNPISTSGSVLGEATPDCLILLTKIRAKQPAQKDNVMETLCAMLHPGILVQ